MEVLLNSLLAQYGLPGIIIGLLVWQQWQNSKSQKSTVSKEDLKTGLNNIQTIVEGQIDNMQSYIQSEREVLKEMIDLNGSKLEMWKEYMDTKFEMIEDNIENQPGYIIESINNRDAEIKAEHDKMMERQLMQGPSINDVLEQYRKLANLDHIFLGSFHNGTSSISGIPYYKFDILAEKYSPTNVERDVDFAHMYLNADLMKHDKLPIILIQTGHVHYTIDENGKSELSKIDDIIYRRMVGRDIKQFTVYLLRDAKGCPMGFVGGVRYDYDEINFNELNNCARSLEDIYKFISTGEK